MGITHILCPQTEIGEGDTQDTSTGRSRANKSFLLSFFMKVGSEELVLWTIKSNVFGVKKKQTLCLESAT